MPAPPRGRHGAGSGRSRRRGSAPRPAPAGSPRRSTRSSRARRARRRRSSRPGTRPVPSRCRRRRSRGAGTSASLARGRTRTGGAEVRSGEEDQRVGGLDGVTDQRGAERADVVRRLLDELGDDVATRGGEPPAAHAEAAADVVGRLREGVGARPGPLQQRGVGGEVDAQPGAPHDVAEGEEGEDERVVEAAEDLRSGEGDPCRGRDCVEGVGRDGGGGEREAPALEGRGTDGDLRCVHGVGPFRYVRTVCT